MTAPTLSPLFDLALEELLDGDVTCRACDQPAVARIAHKGTCKTPPAFACATHVVAQVNFLARCSRAGMGTICVDCATAIPTRDWTITPL